MSRALIETARTLLREGYSPNLEKLHSDKADHHYKMTEQHHAMYGKALSDLHKHITAMHKQLPNAPGDDMEDAHEHMRHLEAMHADVQHHFREANEHDRLNIHHAQLANHYAAERTRNEKKK